MVSRCACRGGANWHLPAGIACPAGPFVVRARATEIADGTIAADALVTALGCNYSPGSPREGWDHPRPWLRRALEDVWGLDLRVAHRVFTLVGVIPRSMNSLRWPANSN